MALTPGFYLGKTTTISLPIYKHSRTQVPCTAGRGQYSTCGVNEGFVEALAGV